MSGRRPRPRYGLNREKSRSNRSNPSTHSQHKKVATVVSVALVNVDLSNPNDATISETKLQTAALAEHACISSSVCPRTGRIGSSTKPETVTVAVGPDEPTDNISSVCTCPENSTRAVGAKPRSVQCSDNFLKNSLSKKESRFQCPECGETSKRPKGRRRRRRRKVGDKGASEAAADNEGSQRSAHSPHSHSPHSFKESRRSILSKHRKSRHPHHTCDMVDAPGSEHEQEAKGVNILQPQGTDRESERSSSRRKSPSKRRGRRRRSKRSPSPGRKRSKRTGSRRLSWKEQYGAHHRRQSIRDSELRRLMDESASLRCQKRHCKHCRLSKKRRRARKRQEREAAREQPEDQPDIHPKELFEEPPEQEAEKQPEKEPSRSSRRSSRYKTRDTEQEGQYTPTMESMGVRACNCDECMRYQEKADILSPRKISPRRTLFGSPKDRKPSYSPKSGFRTRVRAETPVKTARSSTPKKSGPKKRFKAPRTPKGRKTSSSTPKLMDACPSGSLHSSFDITLPPSTAKRKSTQSQSRRIPIARKTTTDSSVRTARSSSPKKPAGYSFFSQRSQKKPAPPPKRLTTSFRLKAPQSAARRKTLSSDMTSPTAQHRKTPVGSEWLKDASELQKRSPSPDAQPGEKISETIITTTKKTVTTIVTTPPVEKDASHVEPPQEVSQTETKQQITKPHVTPDYNPQRDYNPVCDCTNCANLRKYRLEQNLCDCYDCIMALHTDIDTPSCRESKEKLRRSPAQPHTRQPPRVRAKGSYPWVKRLTKVQQPGKPYQTPAKKENPKPWELSGSRDKKKSHSEPQESHNQGSRDTKASRVEQQESLDRSRSTDQSQETKSQQSDTTRSSGTTADSSAVSASQSSGYGTSDTSRSTYNTSNTTPRSSDNTESSRKEPQSSDSKYATPPVGPPRKKLSYRKVKKS
ncbi:hypothetical protein GCK32_010563 [Trichostrongylus colubriformis]|uniref:Uncharacterized protein n=1 Tax=Trichostrongylus colubriformis TaxID=6319 RepID=A0AAN8IXA1_TRICO